MHLRTWMLRFPVQYGSHVFSVPQDHPEFKYSIPILLFPRNSLFSVLGLLPHLKGASEKGQSLIGKHVIHNCTVVSWPAAPVWSMRASSPSVCIHRADSAPWRDQPDCSLFCWPEDSQAGRAGVGPQLTTYSCFFQVTIIGYTLGIPDVIMGITFLAAGTSVPDCMASLIVARQGRASNGIG